MEEMEKGNEWRGLTDHSNEKRKKGERKGKEEEGRSIREKEESTADSWFVFTMG